MGYFTMRLKQGELITVCCIVCLQYTPVNVHAYNVVYAPNDSEVPHTIPC